MNGNGDVNENLTTDSEDADARLGISSVADDVGQLDAETDSRSQGVQIVPVVRAQSFKEAMRISQLDPQQSDYFRALSHPAPPMAAMESGRDSRSSWVESNRNSSRSSWVMPDFPSLEEVLNEWFTSAMARTGSLGSSSGTPLTRTQSDVSASSTPVEGRGVQMRFPSRNSTSGETSPLNMPGFRNKRLSRVFEWEPTPLGSISGSSDSLDSAEVIDDRMNSGSSAEHRLPPGFETGLFDRSFGFRPSLFSSMSQSLSDPHVSRLGGFHSDTGRGSLDAGKVYKTPGESRQPQSTSRVVPIKVITSQSSTGSKASNTDSGSSGGSFAATATDRHVKAAVTKSNSDSLVEERESKPAPDSKRRTLPLSKRSSHSVRLPAGFLTELNPVSISSTSGAKQTSEVGRPSDSSSRDVKIVSVSETNDDRKVRVIPISHEQTAVESCEAPTRKPRSARGRVIPVVVQSSTSVRDGNTASDARNSTNLASSQRSESGAVSIPVTVVQSDGGIASKSSSDRNYFPLCYDADEAGEAVKSILREMTVKRLPIRDTVRLLNTKASRSRSMDFLDSKRHAFCEESPPSSGGQQTSSVKRNTSIASPTIELLPPGFMVGNLLGSEQQQSAAAAAAAEHIQTIVPPVTGDLIRKRLNLFDGVDTHSS